MKVVVSFVCVVMGIVQGAFLFNPQQAPSWSLEEAKAKYKAEYLSTEVEWAKWKGNKENCDEGKIPSSVLYKALKRINYFRTLCGLYPIVFEEQYNKLAQKAAFICLVNDQLSHDPHKNWKCFSEEAYQGANNSSLSFSPFGLEDPDTFISGFIKDEGEANKWVGHRRGLLHSIAGNMGYGATSRTEAIYHTRLPFGEYHLPVPEFIAYPVSGYNEIDLVYPRWSFGIPVKHEVDFTESKVFLTDDTGRSVRIKILPYEDIDDPTIVWEFVDKIKREDLLKKIITVEVKNVKVDGIMKDYSYQVKFFDYLK